jgi:hypothetical protein
VLLDSQTTGNDAMSATQSNDSSAVFVFSRDTPARLIASLSALPTLHRPVYVVDDSARAVNQATVADACQRFGFSYLGLAQYRELLRNTRTDGPQFEFLLREPGFSCVPERISVTGLRICSSRLDVRSAARGLAQTTSLHAWSQSVRWTRPVRLPIVPPSTASSRMAPRQS